MPNGEKNHVPLVRLCSPIEAKMEAVKATADAEQRLWRVCESVDLMLRVVAFIHLVSRSEAGPARKIGLASMGTWRDLVRDLSGGAQTPLLAGWQEEHARWKPWLGRVVEARNPLAHKLFKPQSLVAQASELGDELIGSWEQSTFWRELELWIADPGSVDPALVLGRGPFAASQAAEQECVRRPTGVVVARGDHAISLWPFVTLGEPVTKGVGDEGRILVFDGYDHGGNAQCDALEGRSRPLLRGEARRALESYLALGNTDWTDRAVQGLVERTDMLDVAHGRVLANPGKYRLLGAGGTGKTSFVAQLCKRMTGDASVRAFSPGLAGEEASLAGLRRWYERGQTQPDVEDGRRMVDVARSQLKSAELPTVLIVDAIDEFADSDRVIAALGGVASVGVCVLVSSRTADGIEAWADLLDQTALAPFTPDNVFACLVGAAPGRQRERLQSAWGKAWVERVHNRSAGLPLYVRHVASQMRSGDLVVGGHLPEALDDCFAAELERRAWTDAGVAASDLLVVVAQGGMLLRSAAEAVLAHRYSDCSTAEQSDLIADAMDDASDLLTRTRIGKTEFIDLYHERFRAFLLSTDSLAIARRRGAIAWLQTAFARGPRPGIESALTGPALALSIGRPREAWEALCSSGRFFEWAAAEARHGVLLGHLVAWRAAVSGDALLDAWCTALRTCRMPTRFQSTSDALGYLLDRARETDDGSPLRGQVERAEADGLVPRVRVVRRTRFVVDRIRITLGAAARSVAIDDEERRIATLDDRATVRVFDIETGACLLEEAHPGLEGAKFDAHVAMHPQLGVAASRGWGSPVVRWELDPAVEGRRTPEVLSWHADGKIDEGVPDRFETLDGWMASRDPDRHPKRWARDEGGRNGWDPARRDYWSCNWIARIDPTDPLAVELSRRELEDESDEPHTLIVGRLGLLLHRHDRRIRIHDSDGKLLGACSTPMVSWTTTSHPGFDFIDGLVGLSVVERRADSFALVVREQACRFEDDTFSSWRLEPSTMTLRDPEGHTWPWRSDEDRRVLDAIRGGHTSAELAPSRTRVAAADGSRLVIYGRDGNEIARWYGRDEILDVAFVHDDRIAVLEGDHLSIVDLVLQDDRAPIAADA